MKNIHLRIIPQKLIRKVSKLVKVPPNIWTIKITIFIHPAQEAPTIP